MKEFNKIYIAKYGDFLTMRQLAEDLRTTQEAVYNIKRQMQRNGILEIYKNISDEEWEKLEKLKDWQIKFRYYKRSAIIQEKTKKEIYEELKTESIHEIVMKFDKYDYKKEEFDIDYMQEKDFEDEQWKEITNLNYKISNYGRIKNIQTNKLKKLKHQPYGMQVLLWKNSKSYTITISRLVAEMFIRHLEKNERAIHIDGNAKNNYYKNLKIVSM